MEVISMVNRPKKRNPGADAALKRLAIQVVAQLPDDEADALAVLDYAKTLVRSFLADPGPINETV